MENNQTVEGFMLSGAEVKNAKDKSFVIVEAPEYEEVTFNDKEKRQLKMKIDFGGVIVDYAPNKTSQAKVIAECGRMLGAWVGFKGEFKIMVEKVQGTEREVIYIK